MEFLESVESMVHGIKESMDIDMFSCRRSFPGTAEHDLWPQNTEATNKASADKDQSVVKEYVLWPRNKTPSSGVNTLHVLAHQIQILHAADLQIWPSLIQLPSLG